MIANRIREVRKAAGLSQEELADLVVSQFGGECMQQTISKLENGIIGLDVTWMQKLAQVLGVMPADLLANAAMASLKDEVEPLSHTELGDVASIVATRGLHLYVVNTDSVSQAGIARGQRIGVADSTDDLEGIPSGSIVLVLIGVAGQNERYKMLYQYVEPSLLVTNRAGNNLAIRLDDPTLSVEIIGKVLNPRRELI